MANVRRIYISFEAGTARFFQQVTESEAKLKSFGHTGVSSVQATSGALRVLEGSMTNNLRAAERFIANVLGFGPALQAIFPVVGAVAFAGILTELGKKAYEFYASIRDGADKANKQFSETGRTIEQRNDELDLANDKLRNEIALLEGRHENTLASTLDEVRVVADKLGEALDRDIDKVQKLLKENEISWMRRALGESGIQDLEQQFFGPGGYTGFAQHLDELRDIGRSAVSAAKSPDEANC